MRDRVVLSDQTVAVELHQALVEGLHAVQVAVGHLVVELGRARGVGDPFPHPRVHDEDLDRRNPPASTGAREQTLRHDAPQRRGQRRARLALAMGREELDEPVDGVDRADRRHAGDHEVPDLGCLQDGPARRPRR